jgi:hypothetical protein
MAMAQSDSRSQPRAPRDVVKRANIAVLERLLLATENMG